jgi:glycosyltransferase involved in cell wall biosynthesis
MRGPVTVYRGLYDGMADGVQSPLAAEPVAVFVGRHISEKGVTAVVPAVALARESFPELRCEIFGDGPDRPSVLRQIAEWHLEESVEAAGFVSEERLEEALARALCLVLPSKREGYGLIVVEAAALGVPSILVAGVDNAATELIQEGVNGFIAQSSSPDDLAEAIVRVRDAGPALRNSTARWYADHAVQLSLTSSVKLIERLQSAGEPTP